MTRRPGGSTLLLSAVAFLAFAAGAGIFGPGNRQPPAALVDRGPSLGATASTGGECNIKGNISDRGERIYHMPGQEYYSRTRISPGKGERYFCSEAEARAAGWRRSKV